MTIIHGFAPRTLRLWWPWALHHGMHPIVLAALYDCERCFDRGEPDSWTEISNQFFQTPADLIVALSLSGCGLGQTKLLFPYVDAAQRADVRITPADIITGRVSHLDDLDEKQGLYLAGRVAYALRRGQAKGRSLKQPVHNALHFFARSFKDDDVYLYFSAMLVPVVGFESAAEVEQIKEEERAGPPPKVVPGITESGDLTLSTVLEMLKRV